MCLGFRPRRLGAQVAGHLSNKVWSPHGHRHGGNRWPPLSTIRITSCRFFDSNQRFWQRLRGRWQSVTTVVTYSDHTPGGDMNLIWDKRAQSRHRTEDTQMLGKAYLRLAVAALGAGGSLQVGKDSFAE